MHNITKMMLLGRFLLFISSVLVLYDRNVLRLEEVTVLQQWMSLYKHHFMVHTQTLLGQSLQQIGIHKQMCHQSLQLR